MGLAVVVGLAAMVPGLTGCDQLSARSMVQEGNSLYDDQEYEKAIAKYESALKKEPSLGVIHHNLGLAYARLFRPGVETPENKALVDQAAVHLKWWLDHHPDDAKIRKFLINLWVDAGDYQPVLDYFMAEHQKDPTNRGIIDKIAGIYLARTDWRSSVEWYYKSADAAPDALAKLSSYTNIANVAFGQLWTSKARLSQRGTDRTEIAEVGLEAAEKGIALGQTQDSKHIQVTSYSQQLWNQHSLSQGPYWAASIDRAEAQVFEQRVRVLREEAKKNQPPPAPAGTPAGTGS
jgi:tetratricopeptide (TPR) repeat protein